MDEPLLLHQNEMISLDLSEEEQKEMIIYKNTPNSGMNRVQRICDAQHKLENKKPTLRVETDLSMILIREMGVNNKVVQGMVISTIIDILIRICYYVYLILLLIHHFDQNKPLFLIIYLLTIPRLLLLLALIKIFVSKLHKLKNQSILIVVVLFRQNFTPIDMNQEALREWYDWRQENYRYTRISLTCFLILPNEISYFTLGNNDDKVKTYIVSSFIQKTIEIVTFIPVFLILLYLNKFDLKSTTDPSVHQVQFYSFNQAILALVYIDICKYIFLSVFYLTKRNYQINKK